MHNLQLSKHINPGEGYYPYGLMGMHKPGLGGNVVGPTGSTIASVAAAGAATTGSMLALFAGMSAAGPIGAGVAALIGIGVAVANLFQGCGQTCVEASNIANQLGDQLTQNLNAYLAIPAPRYASMQAAALNNFDTGWNALVSACSDPTLGSAGKACISDRQQGACTWKASPGGWSQDANGNWNYTGYGPAGSGNACWNYFVGMRDPIANDPTVIPDPPSTSLVDTATTTISDLINSVVGTTGSNSTSGLSTTEILVMVGIGIFLLKEL